MWMEWNGTDRYKLENCVFYSNTAGVAGGAVNLLEDQDQVESVGAGILTISRCGNDPHHEKSYATLQLPVKGYGLLPPNTQTTNCHTMQIEGRRLRFYS